MEHFYENIGEDWFTYGEIYSEMVNKFQNGSHFVEIGSWRGRSAAYMAVEIINSGFDIKFDCVDTWEGSVEHKEHNLVKNSTLWDDFKKNIFPVKHVINPIKLKSTIASKNYADNSLDFVFIDAGHSYREVVEDILNWLPKVKINGFIGGHDYLSEENQFCCAGVNNAVNEIFGDDVTARNHSWLHQKKRFTKSKSLI